jgi:hypothetical protein
MRVTPEYTDPIIINPREMRDRLAVLEEQVIEIEYLRAYKEKHEKCRKELSLWVLEMENKHAAFGKMLDRLREAVAPK